MFAKRRVMKRICTLVARIPIIKYQSGTVLTRDEYSADDKVGDKGESSPAECYPSEKLAKTLWHEAQENKTLDGSRARYVIRLIEICSKHLGF